MTERTRNILLTSAFVLLAAFAAWGWMRKPSAAYAGGLLPATAQTLPVGPATAPSYPADEYGRPVQTAAIEGNPCGPVTGAAERAMPVYWSRNDIRTVRPQPVVEQHYVEPDRAAPARSVARHERSKKMSVAIVAGSAGAGAAIGALAGGGKGAGIGALTGGVGGFIYDRLTHKHR